MTTSFLDSLLRPRARSQDIQAFIDGAMRKVEIVPPMTPECRVRPSGIEDFCPRYEAMRHAGKITIKREISSRLQRIFDVGRAYERHLRDMVLAPAGVLIGSWRCLACNETFGEAVPERAKPRPVECPACKRLGSEVMQYVEPFGYVDPERSNLGGSGDGFISWEAAVGLLEVKTANDERFKKVATSRFPFPEHHAQAQVYMRVWNLDRTLFWYHNKNKGDHLALWVVRSDKVQRELVAKAEAIRSYFVTGAVPERICKTALCARAKECLLVKPCFAEAST